MGFIAGPYSATYKGAALGQIDDGFELEHGATIQDITSDSFRAREDGVFQGLEVSLRFVLNEPTAAGVQGLYWPYDATLGTTGVIGRLMTSMAGLLILSKCTGTTASPTTATFNRAILWTDQVNTKFASEQRKIAVNVAVLPVPGLDSSEPMACDGGSLFTFA